jgi:peroxiredoxin
VHSEDPSPNAAITSRTAVVAAVAVAFAMLLLALLWQGTGQDGSVGTQGRTAPPLEPGIVRVGTTAPDFTLTSLDGQAMSLSDYAGRPVVVNFWASWCPPCREEFPVLAAARDAHAESGLEIIGITHNDGESSTRAFVAESGARWPMLPDLDGSTWQAYGGVGLPTSYFIDADGAVERVHIGPVDEQQMADHLAAIGVPGVRTDSSRPR